MRQFNFYMWYCFPRVAAKTESRFQFCGQNNHLQEKLVTNILMWYSKEVQATEYVSETTCDHSIESY